MTFHFPIIQSVVSVTITGITFSVFATDIHSVADFGDYVIDTGTSVQFVQVDDSLQNNDFVVSLNEQTDVAGLQLFAAYSLNFHEVYPN